MPSTSTCSPHFRRLPALYMLPGDVSKKLHLEPIDFRASFRRVVG